MSYRLMWKEIAAAHASLELDRLPLGRRIDQSFQRSVSRWAAWRRKRMEEEAVTATKTAELERELAA